MAIDSTVTTTAVEELVKPGFSGAKPSALAAVHQLQRQHQPVFPVAAADAGHWLDFDCTRVAFVAGELASLGSQPIITFRAWSHGRERAQGRAGFQLRTVLYRKQFTVLYAMYSTLLLHFTTYIVFVYTTLGTQSAGRGKQPPAANLSATMFTHLRASALSKGGMWVF